MSDYRGQNRVKSTTVDTPPPDLPLELAEWDWVIAFHGRTLHHLRQTSEFPTSVVFHQRGMESVEVVHGHGGATEIVWVDE